MKPSNLLLRLLAHLFPGVGPDEIDPPNSDDPPPEDDVDDDPPDGDDVDASADDADDDPPPKPMSRAQREIVELRARAQRAEDEARNLREQPRGPAQPTQQQREFEAEEARLRDSQVSDLEKWQIRSNRTIRQSTENAQAALARAEDARDAAAYDRASVRNPVYDKYRDKVEEIVKAERMAGRLVQREQVLKYVIGEMMIAGNLKSTKKATTGKTTTVPRGQPNTNARSDVPRKGGSTEQDKRRARLENQII